MQRFGSVVRMMAMVAGDDGSGNGGDGAYGQETSGEEVAIENRRQRSSLGAESKKPKVDERGKKENEDHPEAECRGARRTGAALRTRRQSWSRLRMEPRHGWRHWSGHERLDACRMKTCA